MKASQASIYREIERLLEWSIPVTERLPKSLPYKELGGMLIRDLKEALDYVVLAFQAEERLERLEYINAMVMRMTAVKTTYRMIHHARRDAISHGQYAQALDMLTSIADQAGKWLRKTRFLIVEDKKAELAAKAKPKRKKGKAEDKQPSLFDDMDASR